MCCELFVNVNVNENKNDKRECIPKHGWSYCRLACSSIMKKDAGLRENGGKIENLKIFEILHYFLIIFLVFCCLYVIFDVPYTVY